MKTSVLNILVIQASIQAIVYCDLSGKIYLEFEATVDKTSGYIHCTVYYGAHRHEAQTIDIYGPQQKDPVATLLQSETDCTGIYQYHDFRNWCGPGSGVIGESVMYITIKSGLGPRDVGQYYCVLRKSGLKSRKVLLVLADPIPQITTSVPYATSSVPFAITCIVRNATGMINGVQVRLYADDEFAVGVLQYNEFCGWRYTNEIFKGRFRADCGSGTMTYRSFLKRYIFTILNPRSTDKTFVCMVKLTAMKEGREMYSNRITLPFNPITLKLIPQSARTAVGVNFSFICQVNQAWKTTYTVCFRNEKHREWCLKQTRDTCVVLNSTATHNSTDHNSTDHSSTDDRYVIKCAQGTNHSTDQKRYLLTFFSISTAEETRWWCQLKIMKESSKVIYLMVDDFTLSLVSDDPYAIQRKKYLFKCRLTDAAYVNDTLCFHRQDDHSWCITQQLNRCNHSDADQNYILTCGNGTSNTNLTLKVYFLEIRNASAIDGNIWWCQLRKSGVRSNPFNLEAHYLTLSMYGSVEVPLLAKPLGIICSVVNAANMDDEVQFYSNETFVAAVYQKYDKCTVSTKPVSGNHRVVCGNGTQDRVSNVKLFTLAVRRLSLKELTFWQCHTTILKYYSDIFRVQLKKPELLLQLLSGNVGIGMRLTLICRVSYAQFVNDDIQFVRKSDVIASVHQTKGQCSKSGGRIARNYEIICFDGTHKGSSQLKMYKLIIRQFASTDEGNWWCQVNTLDIHSDVLLLSDDDHEAERLMTQNRYIAGFVSASLLVVLVVMFSLYMRSKNQRQKNSNEYMTGSDTTATSHAYSRDIIKGTLLKGKGHDSEYQKIGKGKGHDSEYQKIGKGKGHDSEYEKNGKGKGHDSEYEKIKKGKGHDSEYEKIKIGKGHDSEYEKMKIGKGHDSEYEKMKIGKGHDGEYEKMKIGKGHDSEYEKMKIGKGHNGEYEKMKIGKGHDRDYEKISKGKGHDSEYETEKINTEKDDDNNDEKISREKGHGSDYEIISREKGHGSDYEKNEQEKNEESVYNEELTSTFNEYEHFMKRKESGEYGHLNIDEFGKEK